MRARVLVAAFALVSIAGGFPSPAAAAPSAPPSAADVAEARRLFDTGLRLYGEGSYREALSAFLRANDLAPRASIQRNIAQCARDLKDFAGAYEAYRMLLSKYGATMSVAEKRPIERAIDELTMLTGTVRIDVAEPLAAVTIDGHDAGTTPLAAPVRLNLGPHIIIVTKAGFETIQKEVKVTGGDEVTVNGPMQPEVSTGHLAITASPGASVDVFVDGTDVGPAPWEGDVNPGVHTVHARGADRFSPPKQVDVARRGRADVALELVARTGRVQIDTHTADAAIAVDGTVLGRGVWEGGMEAGEHRMTIEAPGFRTYTRAFVVHEGETFVEDARLVADEMALGGKLEGIYSGLAFLGFAGLTSASNGISRSCPVSSCQSSNPLGGGIALRVGYSFGWIAAEAMAFGSFDHSGASLRFPYALSSGDHEGPARTESYDFYRYGGGGALGVRIATKHPHVRFTAAALGGIATMGNIYNRNAATLQTGASQSSEGDTSDPQTYVAAMLHLEAGVLVGWTNGAKLHASLATWMQFIGAPVVAPASGAVTLGTTTFNGPPLTLAQGTEVFLGPIIGIDFGL